ncbi:MAG TPA: hypothetical protein VGM22_05210 [Methylomirabilota bacterium]
MSFPISCDPAVQKPFERAVALPHSFWDLESVKALVDEINRFDAHAVVRQAREYR